MKILAFSFYFPPHGGPGAIRALKMIKYAAELGAEGAVVCAAEDDYCVRDESLVSEVPEEFMVLRTPDTSNPLRGIQKRKGDKIHSPKSDFFFLPDNKLWWKRPASHLGTIAMPDADLVWATCPPYTAAIAARGAAKELDVPLVLDFRDSWTRNPNRPKLPGPHRIINNRMARRNARASSLVTCVNDAIADEMRQFAPESRIELLPNGYDDADMPETGKSLSTEGPVNLFYLGTIYPDLNYPLPVLEAMTDVTDTTLTVVGRYPDNLKSDIERLGLGDRVFLKDYLPHREALALASKADAMLLYIDGRPLNKGQVTSKTYEYIGLDKPIFACIPHDGEAEQLLGEYPAATIVPTENRSAAAEALRSLIEDKRAAFPRKKTSREEPLVLTRKEIAARWFDMLHEVVGF